jgi:hypothetical protein
MRLAAMSDLLAIFGPAESDAELLEAIAAYRPDRVTVLIEQGAAKLIDEDSPAADALRGRLAELMAVVERRTGAAVVGVAGERSDLVGWRFDRELAPALPLAA